MPITPFETEVLILRTPKKGHADRFSQLMILCVSTIFHYIHKLTNSEAEPESSQH
jgi:hypothetical protein